MKRIPIFTVIVLVVFSSYAQTIVRTEEAKDAAARFAIKENLLNAQTNPRIVDSAICPVVDGRDTLLYIIPVDGYCMIVSRLKCFPPILGYFKSPSLPAIQSEMTEGNYFIQKYCYYSKLASARRINTVSSQWETLYQETPQNPRSIFIDTFLTTKWGQSSSNNTGSDRDNNAYNYYVTESCSYCAGGVSPTGCVAVAMGQIMNYWQYPVIQYRKSAKHQFDWCNMADKLSTLSENYTKERGATFVARIEPCPKCEERDIQVPSPQNDIPARVDEERDENDIMQSRPHIRTSQAVLPQAPLYPNPTSGEVTMEVDGEVEAVVVYNTMGQPVGGWRMLYLSPQRVTLDVGPLPAGPYLMTVRKTDETVLSSKFTKK